MGRLRSWGRRGPALVLRPDVPGFGPSQLDASNLKVWDTITLHIDDSRAFDLFFIEGFVLGLRITTASDVLPLDPGARLTCLWTLNVASHP